MLTNAAVTIWHYDEETERYTRFTSDRVHLYETDGTEDEKGGFTPGRKVILRLFSDTPVANGDLVRRGVFFDEKPDRNECLAVISITDNRESRLLPHRKVVCV